MEDFKNEVRKISSDSIERKLEDERKRNEALKDNINLVVQTIKEDIKHKASIGEFQIKDGKHYVTGCLKWKYYRGYGPSDYDNHVLDKFDKNKQRTTLDSFFYANSEHPILELNIIPKTFFFFHNKYHFKITNEEKIICNNVKRTLKKDNIEFAYGFAFRNKDYDTHNHIEYTDELIFDYKPAAVTIFYEYEFVY